MAVCWRLLLRWRRRWWGGQRGQARAAQPAHLGSLHHRQLRRIDTLLRRVLAGLPGLRAGGPSGGGVRPERQARKAWQGLLAVLAAKVGLAQPPNRSLFPRRGAWNGMELPRACGPPTWGRRKMPRFKVALSKGASSVIVAVL
jgi:hypothetical protein